MKIISCPTCKKSYQITQTVHDQNFSCTCGDQIYIPGTTPVVAPKHEKELQAARTAAAGLTFCANAILAINILVAFVGVMAALGLKSHIPESIVGAVVLIFSGVIIYFAFFGLATVIRLLAAHLKN